MRAVGMNQIAAPKPFGDFRSVFTETVHAYDPRNCLYVGQGDGELVNLLAKNNEIQDAKAVLDAVLAARDER